MKKNIEYYSDPKQVFKMAKKYFGKNVDIDYSTKADKKFMILNPENNKWVHFGLMGYEDYTKHKDLQRRNRFRNRNKKWAYAPKYSPAYMAYYILW